MRRIAWVVAFLVAGQPVAACTFCAGSLAGRQTLREHHRTAVVVLVGTLRNPRFDPAGGGTTEFQVRTTVKADRGTIPPLVTVRQYLPVIGDTPPDFVLFCGRAADGTLDPFHGGPCPPAVARYLADTAKVADADSPARLAFFFKRLDAREPAVAADAFLELAKTPDAELVKAKAGFDPQTVRKLLTDPATPAERLGVFALLLGLCGSADDARFLAAELDRKPLADRVRENHGGYLTALALLDPEAGWRRTTAALTDPARPFDQRLSALGTVRFFQATRPAENRDRILACYRAVLSHGDIADLAVEDLRRWKWWELTPDVLATFDRPTHAGTLVRRGIVRYALSCPRDEAKRFVESVRGRDPKLVAAVEEGLKLSEGR